MAEPLSLREQATSRPIERLSEALDSIGPDETLEVRTDSDPLIPLAPNSDDRLQSGMASRFLDVTDDSWRIEIKNREPESGDGPLLDVRNIAPKRRHEILLETFDELDPNDGFVLLNDHDPKPLSHELRSTRGDTFDWDYLRREPGAWHVAIEKTAETTTPESSLTTTCDIRDIASGEAYESIDHRFRMLPEGATMEVIAEQEPRALHREFQETYGDGFDWQIVYADPDEFRIRVTKTLEPQSGPAEAPPIDVTQHLDVRDRPPARRHEAIFEAYEELALGEGFVLVNDHDPKPLYHQFDAEARDAVHWEYRHRDPDEFRVLIGKTQHERETTPPPDESDPPS